MVGRVQLRLPVIFVVELGLKTYVYRKTFFKDDKMNVLDFLVVAVDLFGVFVSLVGLKSYSLTAQDYTFHYDSLHREWFCRAQ